MRTMEMKVPLDNVVRTEYEQAMADVRMYAQDIYETLARTHAPTDLTWDDVQEAKKAKKTLRDLYNKMTGKGLPVARAAA